MKKLTVPLALVLVLAACGNDPVGETSTTTVDTTSTTVATSTTSESTTTLGTEASDESDGFPVTVEADNGEVTIESRPERIVSISPTGTEMLYSVGAGDQVVAVDEFSYFPPEAPVTDLSGFTPNVEAIAGYEPDLVIVASDIDGLVGSLEGLGIAVLHLDAVADFEGISDQLRTIGAATGHADQGESVAMEVADDIEAAIAEARTVAIDGLTVYHELDPTFYTVTSNTFIGSVYSAFGLGNIADGAEEGNDYPQLGEEYIVSAAPDLIFFTNCCGDTVDSIGQRPGWDSIPAVQNGLVIEVDADISSRWSARIVEFFDAVSDALVEAAEVAEAA